MKRKQKLHAHFYDFLFSKRLMHVLVYLLISVTVTFHFGTQKKKINIFVNQK